MRKMPISLIRWGILILLLVLLACTSGEEIKVVEAPQTDTEYVQTEYQGQLSAATVADLEKKYPKDFWKAKPLDIPPSQRRTIAIREFTGLAQPDELGRTIAEIFTTTFAKSGAFNLIERQQLDKVLNEFELNQSGIIDEATAEQIGQIKGVDAIVTGSVSQVDNNARIDARVIDIATGSVILAETLSPVINSQGANLRPVDVQNIGGLARKMVDQMVERFYR